MLAKYSGCKVIAVDYALAPECAFPDGFNDCFNAFCKIIHMYPDAKITLVGESAGTNLYLALALKVKDMQKIACVLVHNFTGSLDRTEHIVDDFTVKEGCLNPLNQIYVAENKADNPFISPLLGNFINFPPTFITCDYNKTLYADAKTLYQKCEQANVDVELIEMSIKSVIGGTSEELTTLEPDIKNVHKTNTSFWDTIGSNVLGVTALPSYGAFVSEEKLYLLGDITNKKVLEIGCGNGHSLKYVSDLGAVDLWGIDISPNQIERTNDFLLSQGINAKLICSPMENECGIPKNYFDVIYSVYTIGWTTDLNKSFSKISSYLKKDGIFIFSWSHPIHKCVSAENNRFTFCNSYFDESWYSASVGDKSIMLSNRKLSTYINALSTNGLVIEQLIEETDEDMLQSCDDSDFINKAKILPVTFIIKARKL